MQKVSVSFVTSGFRLGIYEYVRRMDTPTFLLYFGSTIVQRKIAYIRVVLTRWWTSDVREGLDGALFHSLLQHTILWTTEFPTTMKTIFCVAALAASASAFVPASKPSFG